MTRRPRPGSETTTLPLLAPSESDELPQKLEAFLGLAIDVWGSQQILDEVPTRSQVEDLLRSTTEGFIQRINAENRQIDMVAVEMQRAFIPAPQGEPQAPVARVLVGQLAAAFNRDPYALESWPFFDWTQDLHLRICLFGSREGLQQFSNRNEILENTFVTALPFLEEAEDKYPDDVEKQVKFLIEKQAPRFIDFFSKTHRASQSRDPLSFAKTAQRAAARVALQSTRYTRLLMTPAETLSESPYAVRNKWPALGLPHTDQRNLLFIPVIVGGHAIGGAAVYSHDILDDVAVTLLDVGTHILLYRIRSADEVAAAKVASTERARAEATLLYVQRMAHDVRKPAHHARTVLKELLDKHATDIPPSIAEPLHQLLTNLDDLQNLIATPVGTLTDEVREQARKDARPQRLSRLLNDAAWIWKLEAKKHGKILDVDAEPEAIVTIPRFLILEVLENLLANAMKAPSRRVELKAIRCFDRPTSAVKFLVRDDGGGFDPAIRAKLFVPHYATGPTPHGLGLYLSNFIVTQLLDGEKLEIDSHPPYTTVSFIIPEVKNVNEASQA